MSVHGGSTAALVGGAAISTKALDRRLLATVGAAGLYVIVEARELSSFFVIAVAKVMPQLLRICHRAYAATCRRAAYV